MEVLSLETDLERVVSLHSRLPGHLSPLQTRTDPGPADHHEGPDPLVQEAVHGSAPHLPAGLLRVAGCEAVVGAVLQAPVAG